MSDELLKFKSKAEETAWTAAYLIAMESWIGKGSSSVPSFKLAAEGADKYILSRRARS